MRERDRWRSGLTFILSLAALTGVCGDGPLAGPDGLEPRHHTNTSIGYGPAARADIAPRNHSQTGHARRGLQLECVFVELQGEVGKGRRTGDGQKPSTTKATQV